MKLLLPICLLAASQLLAAVPTAINYQGRLTDGDGNPASGSKTFSLKIHDAATVGNEIYNETIGSVVVDANGIYNFQFGANGSSVVATDTVIATTNGSSQVFNATLDPLPIDGSVIISDGTYTWSQVSGASDPTQFTGSVTPATGAVSAIYLSGAPASGTEIAATYNFMESGLSGALTTGSAHWLELTINGETQTPRERVLSVPFAQVAERLAMRKKITVVKRLYDFYSIDGTSGTPVVILPKSATTTGINRNVNAINVLDIPTNGIISSIRSRMSRERLNEVNPYGKASVELGAFSNSGYRVIDKASTTATSPTTYSISPNQTVVESETYVVKIYIGNDPAINSEGGGRIDWIEIEYIY